MQEISDFFNRMLEKLEEDFSYKNINGDDVGIEDYQNEIVPLKRVSDDRDKCLHMISDRFGTEKDMSKRELLIAAYCNFYIKCGMAGRLQAEAKGGRYGGLDSIFAGLEEEQQYLKDLYDAIEMQDYRMFEQILQRNEDSVVAKLYKFVKLCHRYCQEVADKLEETVVDVNRFEDMWTLYESLPEYWRQYVLGAMEKKEKGRNYAYDRNLLPYVQMISMKEILMEYIPAYYFKILDTLGIAHDIESESVCKELLGKLGVESITDFFAVEIPKRCKGLSEDEMVVVMVDSALELLEMFGNSVERLNSIRLNLTCLLEKIHDLQYSEREDWQEGKEWTDTDSFSEMPLAYRSAYLHIPVRGPVSRTLFLAQYDVFLKQRTLKKQEIRKREMMDYYAHSWKHIAYPQIVREVAEELSKTNVSLANRLMKAYHSEKTLQRSIQLLQYINSDDEMAVSRAFKEGMALSGRNSGTAVCLEEVIDESLDLVVFKLLMTESDDSSKMEKCRHKWSQVHSMETLREKYVHDFLEGGHTGTGILTWVNENILQADITADEEWNRVRFRTDSFALNQFKEILVEIFTNIFLHGEKYMQIRFESRENWLEITAENACSGKEAENRKGISTMAGVLASINFGTEINSIEKSLENGIYRIVLRLDKKLMIRKGR